MRTREVEETAELAPWVLCPDGPYWALREDWAKRFHIDGLRPPLVEMAAYLARPVSLVPVVRTPFRSNGYVLFLGPAGLIAIEPAFLLVTPDRWTGGGPNDQIVGWLDDEPVFRVMPVRGAAPKGWTITQEAEVLP